MKPNVPIRWVLVFLCHLLTLIKAMTNISLSLTIVAMVNSTTASHDNDSSQDYTDVCPSNDEINQEEELVNTVSYSHSENSF